MDMPDFKRLLMDSTYCKAHPHAAGAKGGSEAPGRTKGGSTPGYIWPWLRMVCRSESLLEKATRADIRQVYSLVEGLSPKLVIADRHYSAKAFRNQLEEDDIQAVIPEIRRDNKPQKQYDKNYIRCAVSLKIHSTFEAMASRSDKICQASRLLFWQSSKLAALLYIAKTYDDTT